MMTSPAAASLTEQQLKKSLIAKKKKPLPGKTVLCSPYVAKWPPVEVDVQQNIVHQLKKFFEDHSIVNRSAGKKRRKKDGEELKLTAEQQKLRSRLICGVQKVTRCLERSQLQLVVVDRSSPWQLHQHLAQLAAVRRCAAIAVNNLESTLTPLLDVTRLCTVGFMKTEEIDDLTQVIDGIVPYCPTIELPWLETEHQLQSLQQSLALASTATADVGKDKKMDVNPTGNGNPVDYSHLYIFKRDREATAACDKQLGDFVPLASSSSEAEEIDSDDDSKFNFRAPKVDKRKVETYLGDKVRPVNRKNKDQKDARKSSYKSANIGVQLPNPNKKRKKKS